MLASPFLQGIVGNIPWNAMVFFTLYFQLLGMSDFDASLLMVCALSESASLMQLHMLLPHPGGRL